MKKTILTAITILSVFGLSACGNVQKSDKEVSGVTTTTSASVVTTVTTARTTTVDEVTTTSDTTVTTEPTTKTETTTTPIVTTSATTTTTVTTAKATTTTTKKTQKATTTTTTAKKTTTTAPKIENTSVNNLKGTTMWVSKDQSVVYIKNQKWGYEDWNVYKGDKVTAYETVTLPGDTLKVTKIKTSDGKIGYTTASILSKTEIKVKYLTQSDVDKMVKELQEYSNSKDIYGKQEYTTYRNYGKEYNTYDEYCDYLALNRNPETCQNWTFPTDIYTTYSYDEAYQTIKEYIDFNYDWFPDSHIIVYLRWCPKGQGNTNTYETKDCWEVYALRC